MKNYFIFIGRICISVIFIMSGFSKIMDPSGTQQYMTAYGMPLTGLFLVLAIIFELAGGFSVLLGFKARFGALLLIIFLISVTLIFHTKFSEQLQVIMFLKNLAILGGLIMVASFGAGSISFDGHGSVE